MTYQWYGTSNYTPGDAVNFASAKMGQPHILALRGTDKVLVDWVAIDQTNTSPARHAAAVGPITAGVFLPDTEVLLAESIVEASFSSIGGSYAFVEGSHILFTSFFEDGASQGAMVIARTNLDLSSPVVKVIDISDGFAQTYLRNGFVSFGGHYFRLHYDPTDGVTVTVTALDSSFSDGAISTFTVADAHGQIASMGHGAIVSGSYAAFSPQGIPQYMAHFDGSTIDDVWTRAGSTTTFLAPAPTPGAFAAQDESNNVIGVTLGPSRVETTTAGPFPIVPSGVFDASQGFTGHTWTFETGAGGT